MQIAIDIGGTFIKVALISREGIVARDETPAKASLGLGPMLPRIEMIVDGMVDEHGTRSDPVVGVGIAFPGPVNAATRSVMATNAKFDDAVELDLSAWVETHWNVPLAMDNDARLAGVGEWKYGAARGFHNVVTITLGTGIGTGVVIDDHVLRGPHFQAGSLGGHISIDAVSRERCSCGNLGCAEAIASTWALRRDLERMEPTERDRLLDGKALESYGFKDLFSRSTENSNASRMLERYLDAWGALVVSLIHAYDPELVVLTGGVSAASDALLGPVAGYVEEHAWTPTWRPGIVLGEQVNTAALLGAAYIASGEPIEFI